MGGMQLYRKQCEKKLAQNAFDRVTSINPSLAYLGQACQLGTKPNEAFDCCLIIVRMLPLLFISFSAVECHYQRCADEQCIRDIKSELDKNSDDLFENNVDGVANRAKMKQQQFSATKVAADAASHANNITIVLASSEDFNCLIEAEHIFSIINWEHQGKVQSFNISRLSLEIPELRMLNKHMTLESVTTARSSNSCGMAISGFVVASLAGCRFFITLSLTRTSISLADNLFDCSISRMMSLMNLTKGI
ncbi:Tetratricopeptide-like helical [Artemisia annua]|uniref:Tetratricopeptide-like helical n=1 Tax=Artemisia annua TaxID=35608 RepID=A0A2U1LF63_ARTAN|nr:Tetratricopeptide-like helical [Artemisia annua]